MSDFSIVSLTGLTAITGRLALSLAALSLGFVALLASESSAVKSQ